MTLASPPPPASCVILAGPNGSGKSTIYEALRPPGEFVNADMILRELDAKRSNELNVEAGKQTLVRLENLLSARHDFTYETTLSGRQPIGPVRRARAIGYQVGLIFVALPNPDMNVLRVAERVKRGGHDIPEATIRRRYPKSFENLSTAIGLAHACLVYENSAQELKLLLRIQDGQSEEDHLDETYPHHRLIAEAARKALAASVTI